jgi:23S rRNA (uridine2552-2'-O)-methyltransferase
LPKAWIQQRKKDYYYKKAKEEKYRSRAAYKLLQSTEKYHFMKRGDIVIDLGAAPGGWIQAARKTIGSKGFVLGVDLKLIEPFPQYNIQTIVGDLTAPETLEQILTILSKKADVVMSDASPNISGIWEVDHARQIDLAEQSLKIALKTLRSSGSFLVKVFEGDLLNNFIAKVKDHFEIVRIIKPKASRAKSSELFILGMRLKKTLD